MCLAQGHNAVTPVRLEPAAPQPQVKHSTTEPPNGNVVTPNKISHAILQRNYRKMTINRSFSYNFFVKLYLYNMNLIQMDRKDSVIKRVHCMCTPTKRSNTQHLVEYEKQLLGECHTTVYGFLRLWYKYELRKYSR